MRGFLRPYRLALCVSAALALVDTMLGLARPWPMQLAVDHAIGHRPLSGPLHGFTPGAVAVVAAAGAVGLVAVSGVTGYLTSYLSGAAAERIGADLRARAYERLLLLSPRFHDRNHSGDLVTRLTGDVSRVQDALVVWLVSAVPDALTLLGLLVVLLAIDPGMTTVALVVVPPLAGLAALRRRQIKRAQRESRARQGDLAARAAESLRHVRAVQAFAQQDAENRRFRAENLGVVRARARQHGGLEGIRPGVDALAGPQPEHGGWPVGDCDHRPGPEPVRDHDQHPRGHSNQGDDPEDDADHRQRADIAPDFLGVPVPGLIGLAEADQPVRAEPGEERLRPPHVQRGPVVAEDPAAGEHDPHGHPSGDAPQRTSSITSSPRLCSLRPASANEPRMAATGLFSSCAMPAESLPNARRRSICASRRVASRTRSASRATKRGASAGMRRRSSGNSARGKRATTACVAARPLPTNTFMREYGITPATSPA